MIKLNVTSELFATGGFRKPNVRKNLSEINYEREKRPYLQFHKLYDSTWVVATDFCSINLFEDCCDLMSQPFVKVNFVVVDVPQAPTKALTGHCAIIFAYYKSDVSFQKLVLPHDDIGK